MALPGKLCIGILEEDNPQKSYFRFKPLLVSNGEEFEVYPIGEEFPEHGCIRIVPDKNESSRFKARMRRIGRYCLVDLRDHPDENDKIRPNKNYHGDDVETNAFIIYSDVVRELPEGKLAEILEQDVVSDESRMTLNVPAPFSSRVVFSGCEPLGALWTHEPSEGEEEGCVFTRTQDTAAEDTYQKFELTGFGDVQLRFLLAKPGHGLYTPVVENRFPAEMKPEAKPALEMKAAGEIKPSEAKPVETRFAEAKPAEQRAVPEGRVSREPAERNEIKPAADAPKPWLYHDESVMPRPVDPRLPPREQAIALQTGINPKRGRSLQEIIDEKWRHSRFDQLGHPVPGDGAGHPVSNPVENAVDAVRAAWEYPSARVSLTRALAQIDELPRAMAEEEDHQFQETRASQLEELSSTRDALKSEIESYQDQKERLEEEFVAQMRADNAEEISAHARKIQEMEQRQQDLEHRAEESRNIAASAEDAIARLTDEKLTARLSEYAVNSRAADLLVRLGRGEACRKPSESAGEPAALEEANVPMLARRIVDYFNQSGCPIVQSDAINLMACLALGRAVLFTGPAGSGKTMQAKLLMEALGLADKRTARYEIPRPGEKFNPFPEESPFPGVVFADDVNVRPQTLNRIVDDLEPLESVKLVMTAQDSISGLPLNVRLLDRCFTVRIRPDGVETPWEPANSRPAPVEGTITARALQEIFSPDPRNVPMQVKNRLNSLRVGLNRYGVLLSRRTLNDLWTYCASVAPYLNATPLESLDLALSQRALPAILAGARLEALRALPELLIGLPRCQYLLKQPFPVEI